MFIDPENTYPAGAFDIGDKVYGFFIDRICDQMKNVCLTCESTGVVIIKGEPFICPKCRGNRISTRVIEVAKVSGPHTIKSKVTITNKKGSREIYYTEPGFTGYVISRSEGENNFSRSAKVIESRVEKFNERKKGI